MLRRQEVRLAEGGLACRAVERQEVVQVTGGMLALLAQEHQLRAVVRPCRHPRGGGGGLVDFGLGSAR